MPEPREGCSRCAGAGYHWVNFYHELALEECPCTRYLEEGAPDLGQSADHDNGNQPY